MTRTTIKDIAADVGVSHTTVSYVLNRNPNQKISAKTRQAVLEAAKRLNYVPNETARSLRSDSTKCIAVALEKSIMRSRFYSILQGIREELITEGYGLLLMDFQARENSQRPDYLESVLKRKTDGIIYIASDGQSPECSASIAKSHIPFVSCDCCPEEEELVSVSFDYEKGAFEVACRLFGEGSTKIIYWQPDVDTFQEHYRMDGLKRAQQLYPNTTLEFIKLPYISRHTISEYDTSQIDNLCQQCLVQSILPQLSNTSENIAIICSWGIMVKHLCAALYQKASFDCKIALLSDADVPLIPGIKILTSRPRFFYGGKQSAKLLLSQIRKEGPVNNIVLDPEPPTYV
ncbi:MAG: LacI family DNA-binding transcriptional regulator [Lachnospiraceae bacterium]|nr:LacI family DNA-binding transcriptional regulator [Lachnospiraceae bacterium]